TITTTNGLGSGATATAVLTNGVVTAINVTNPGTGFTANPIITIAPPFSTALGTAQANAGQVNPITTISGGSGYIGATPPTVTLPPTTGGAGTPAAPPAAIAGGGGSGAAATAILAGSTVAGINFTSGGSGYASAPTVTFSAPPAGGTPAAALATFVGNFEV